MADSSWANIASRAIDGKGNYMDAVRSLCFLVLALAVSTPAAVLADGHEGEATLSHSSTWRSGSTPGTTSTAFSTRRMKAFATCAS